MTKNNSATSDHPKKGTGSHKRILIGIIIAIIVGTLVGGWLPNLAVKFSILCDIFLNSLMMIVVPLVIFSMIVGITGLGDILKIGSIGRRTVIYYMVTTGISVIIGIILVNIVQPGKDISAGEKHSAFSYTIAPENNRTVIITNATWDKTNYNEKYLLVLQDQKVQGTIELISENSVIIQ